MIETDATPRTTLSAEETRQLAREWGLTGAEYDRILAGLGRLPSVTEVAMFSVEWCEHCGYPKSRRLLALLPKTSARCRVLVGADSGGFYLTDDLAVVMKVESHNHPSQVEPFQGAATGVGGILRDIFTVGARPIASGNSLRFGKLDDPYTRYLIDGVVRGIAHYGNCLVGNESLIWRDQTGVYFDTIGGFVESHLSAGQQVAELAPGARIETLSLDPNTLRSCWRPVRRVFRRRASSLVRLRTTMGRTVTVTSDHAMLLRDKDGWYLAPAASLHVGDQIPLLVHMPSPPAAETEGCAAPLDLIAAWGKGDGLAARVFVALPSAWRPTEAVRAAMRAIEPSITKRCSYLTKRRLPLAHFVKLEALLGVPRRDVTLYRCGKANQMRAVIEPDESFARLLGYYLAEGCVSRNGKTFKIIFTFARHEQVYADDVVEALTRLGLRPCVETRASTIAVYATSWLLGHVFKEVWGCGSTASDKAIAPFVFAWPRRLQREVLKGLLRGDGSLSTRTHGSHAKIAFASASRTLFEQTVALVQNEGAVPVIYRTHARERQIRGRPFQGTSLWQFEVCSFEGLNALADLFDSARNERLAAALAHYQGSRYSFPRFHRTEDVATVKVRSLETVSAGECNVYNVEVEGTHLFATSFGVVTHNCTGVPTVVGEVGFNPSYEGNCLVNAMAVGVAPAARLVTAAASGPGNPVLYVGSSTGRDGIGGCSVLASHEFGHGDEKRPTVQIGDPFTEKCLIEACLEAIETGAVVAMKDMGAAGVTCTTSEMAAAGGVGMRVELQRIPRRESGVEPYEVMMSESQERMLLVAQRGREEELIALFRKWELNAVVVGEVTADGMLSILDDGERVAHVSAEFLTSPPKYEMPVEEPAYLREAHAFDPRSLPEPADHGDALLRLLGSPNIASKRWVWEQYDHMVQINTVVGPGADAAVLRIKEAAPQGIALTMDCNSRLCYLDPYEGARLAVAEAARNLACVGAEPRIVTDGLNFGNPDKPDRYWQFQRAVEGLADACREFDVAVVSGNVSFYNESPEGPIHPTPIVGMLGVLPDAGRHVTAAFREAGDVILLVGELTPESSLGGSEYLHVIHGREAGRPARLNGELERRVQRAVRDLVREGLVCSAHDCAEGGLAVALAECCLAGRRGAEVLFPQPPSAEVLFGEAPSRVILSIAPDDCEPVRQRLEREGVPAMVLGQVGGDTLAIDGALALPVSALEETWELTLPKAMGT